MYLQLGPMVFEVTGPVVGLTSREEFPFAEHATVQGKPQLEAVGEALASVSLDLALRRSLGDVPARLAQLRQMAAAREALPLLWGSGQYAGRFVIRELEQVTQSTDAAGVVTSADVRVALTEWADRVDGAERRREPRAVASRQQGQVRRAEPARPSGGNPRAVPPSQITRQAR